eukprot:6810684-Ditylum_brightwellii.AAC.1
MDGSENDPNGISDQSTASSCYMSGMPYAIGNAKHLEKSRPRCTHYERYCTLISPCCGLAFGCRICHDDCPVLPPPIFQIKKQQEQERQQRLKEDAMAEEDSGASGANK